MSLYPAGSLNSLFPAVDPVSSPLKMRPYLATFKFLKQFIFWYQFSNKLSVVCFVCFLTFAWAFHRRLSWNTGLVPLITGWWSMLSKLPILLSAFQLIYRKKWNVSKHWHVLSEPVVARLQYEIWGFHSLNTKTSIRTEKNGVG